MIANFVTTNKDLKGDTTKLFIQDGLEMFCCIVAIIAIWPIFKEERLEVNMMKKTDAAVIGADDNPRRRRKSVDNSMRINRAALERMTSS